MIYTDLGADQARSADPNDADKGGVPQVDRLRLRRSRAETATVFVRDPDDFYAAGGPAGTAGAFIGNALLAIASQPGNWHILQHEGFHQFVAAAPGHSLPPWVEEGMGGTFWRERFHRRWICFGGDPRMAIAPPQVGNHQPSTESIASIVRFVFQGWNEQFSLANYDQAWSLVQFLAHGAKGRYCFAFAEFIKALRIGRPAEQAWADHFPAAERIQKEWEDEWLGFSDDPTRVLYAQAAVAALSSCLGRATAQGQRFESFADFSLVAESGGLRSGRDDWLPPSIALGALTSLRGLGATCTLLPGAGVSPRIVAVLPEHVQIIGDFVLRGGRVKRVRTEAGSNERARARL